MHTICLSLRFFIYCISSSITEDSVNGMIKKLSKEKQENLKVLAASGPDLNVAIGTHAFGRFVYNCHLQKIQPITTVLVNQRPSVL
jgi:hypothetical protein